MKRQSNKEFKLKEFNIDLSVTRMANIHYFEFTNKYSTFKDRHPFKELIFVDSGSITVEAEGYSGALGTKELLIHKENEEHSLSCVGSEAPNVIIIGFECECERLDPFSTAPVPLSDDLIKTLTEIIKEGRSVFLPPYDVPNLKDMKKRKSYAFGSDQMLKLKLEIFLIELVRTLESETYRTKDAKPDKKTEEICQYLNDHYKEKISLDNLCFLFGTNKTTLCKNFKDAYGETIVSYINRRRIKKAKSLMREGELSLTQVAFASGFSSIHYFSKTFKLHEHRSPSEYISTVKAKLDL